MEGEKSRRQQALLGISVARFELYQGASICGVSCQSSVAFSLSIKARQDETRISVPDGPQRYQYNY